MNPTLPASTAIALALRLGILLRPVAGATGIGEAYFVRGDHWFLYVHGQPMRPASVPPRAFIGEWELLTEGMVAEEYLKSIEDPW